MSVAARLLVAVAVAYAAGSAPLGLWLTRRVRHIDVRDWGTGNVGTSNIFRNAGLPLAVVVGPLQFLQGVLPVVVAQLLGLPPAGRLLAGLVAVAGNGWSVWLDFAGGRGIAVASGAVAVLDPPAFAVLLAFFAAGAALRGIAPGVLAGFVALPVVALLQRDPVLAVGFAVLLAIVVARRLDGVRADLRGAAGPHVLRDRLLFDRRPGTALVGPHPVTSPP